MRKILFTVLAMAAISVNGQSIRLGLAYHKAQKQRKERRMQNAAKCETQQKAPIAKNVRIDEATDVRGDNQYRYVFAYNKNMERSSETIYKRHFEDGKWSDEEFCNKGIYTYEYDTQGRIVSKTVKYENQDDYDFESYNISVDYKNPEYTAYKKVFTKNYSKDAEWSFYKNGQLRHYDCTNSNRAPHPYLIKYDENGSCIEFRKNGNDRSLTGTLNDSTITHGNGMYNSDGSIFPVQIEHYVYDSVNGKLKEYKVWGQCDACKLEYVYDAFGRISAIRKSYERNDDESVDVDPGVAGSAAAVSKRERDYMEEPEWRLEYNETFTYFNYEVYGVGNPWHDVLGFDGPLTNRHLVDDDFYDVDGDNEDNEEPWVEDLTFNRDANGKLLSVVSTKPEDNGEIVEKYTVDVDADGHITREYSYSKETYNGAYYENIATIDYHWENGTISSAKQTDEDNNKSSEGHTYGTRHEYDFAFSYADGYFGYKISLKNGHETDGSVTQRNKGYKRVENNKYGENLWIQEVQTEDVRFVRPNLLRDYEGFTTDSTIVASVKDRVVVFGKSSIDPYGILDYGWSVIEWEANHERNVTEAYCNTNEDTYFSISHDGDQTVCSNYKGQPRFVLQDGKLLKEIIYEDAAYNAGVEVPNNAVAHVAIPTGEAYKEITYQYDANGLVVGQTVTTVDENGATTDEVTVEVKYDPASGIDNMMVSTDGKLSLNGRTIGLADGQTFSVFTLGGTQLSADTQEFTFPKAGVYMISLNGKTVKLNIK